MPSHPPKYPHRIEGGERTLHDPDVLAQGDVIANVALPLLNHEPIKLEASGDRYIAVEGPITGPSLALVQCEIVSAIIMSFDCEIFKVLRSLHKRKGNWASPADIAHVAAVRPLPSDSGQLKQVKDGAKYGAIYLPAVGTLVDGFVDLYTYQPYSMRALVREEAMRISGLSVSGRMKLGLFLAQFLGDDDRRQNTDLAPSLEERAFLGQVKAMDSARRDAMR